MLGTSWECHKVREFALRPMGDILLVLDRMLTDYNMVLISHGKPKNTVGTQYTN